MIKNFKNKIKKNIEIFGLILLISITTISTSYFNYSKKKYDETYNNFIENIYFKKTLNYRNHMKLIQLKVTSFIRKNTEVFLLMLLLVVSTLIIQVYNSQSKKVDILRREVWTVKVTKICRTHFNII